MYGLTPDEREAQQRAEAAARKKIAAAQAGETEVNADWDSATRRFWPEEAAQEVTLAGQRLAEGAITQQDHDLLVASIQSRTRALVTPETIKAAFEEKLAAARGAGASDVDSLTDEQRDALWDSIR